MNSTKQKAVANGVWPIGTSITSVIKDFKKNPMVDKAMSY